MVTTARINVAMESSLPPFCPSLKNWCEKQQKIIAGEAMENFREAFRFYSCSVIALYRSKIGAGVLGIGGQPNASGSCVSSNRTVERPLRTNKYRSSVSLKRLALKKEMLLMKLLSCETSLGEAVSRLGFCSVNIFRYWSKKTILARSDNE